MPTPEEKTKALKKLRPQVYQIYGIFNFKTRELTYVTLDPEEVEFQFDLQGCGEECDIVTFVTQIN